ncbi:carbohydrate binding family 9 domain-containing protein [candidate division KSB1 bacterium]
MKPKIEFLRLLGLSLLVFSSGNPALAAAPARELTAIRATTAPLVDGFMEPVWENAQTADGFIQKEPLDGVPASQSTEVRVMYDDTALYFFFSCHDDDPERIIGREMKRDTYLRGDDIIEIYLDTFNDRRNMFFFRTNPLGAREDATITDGGQTVTREWNGVWECSSKMVEDGWCSEIAIPWRTLRFPKQESLTIGLNLGRTIRRHQEETYWSRIPRDLGRYGQYRAEHFGQLFIPETPGRRTRFEAKPYVLGGLQREYDPRVRDTVGEIGLDMKAFLTSNLTMDVTLNTDFAQVEADEEVVNVSRFSLFFPEKRDFFLEGAGIFDVGATRNRRLGRRLGIYQGVAPYSLFYSRQIGIHEGNAIPITGAGKLTGKIGPYTVGLMDIVTSPYEGLDLDDLPFELSRQNFGVVRVKRDLFQRSNVGFIATENHSIGNGDYNRTLGLDGGFYFGPNLSFVYNTAYSDYSGAEQSADKTAQFAEFTWRNDIYHGNTYLMHIGEGFEPGMGFLRRGDLNSFNVHSGFTPRINSHGIRNMAAEYTLDYVADTGNKLESREHILDCYVRSSVEDRLSFSHSRRFEYLAEVDSIRSVILPTGIYKFNSNVLSLYLYEGRMLAGNSSISWGDFYHGRKTSISTRLGIKPVPRLITQLTLRRDMLNFPEKDVTINTVGTRITYSFTPDLYFKTYIQYNDYDDRALVNLLLHWIYSPGSDFFIVYNEDYDSPESRFRISRRTFMIKCTYRY